MAFKSPLLLATSCLLVSACFAPNLQGEEIEGGSTGSPSTSETGEPTSGITGELTTGAPTTGAPTTGAPTTGAPTTGAPTTGSPTTGTPTTGAPTTTTSDPTTAADDSSTDDTAGEVGGPACGDGTIDEDEECDEGGENGGAACTELCTIPVCGDEIVSGDEACDDGEANGMELGNCAPDCSTLVEARAITMAFDYSQNGDLGGPGMSVDYVDARCESSGAIGYKALFADGTDRRATVSPNTGDGQIDWVLRPWTRYIRDDGELVWVTDASALLGIRDGQPMDLVNAINGTTYSTRSITGMRTNWIAHTLTNCSEWSSSSSGGHRPQGDPQSVSAAEFLDDEIGIGPTCASYGISICVEQ